MASKTTQSSKYDPVKLRKELGIRLRSLRKEANMTQAALAARAGIGNEFVSRLEHGHGSPSLDTLGKLALALNVPVSELFTFPEHEEPTVAHLSRRIERVLNQVNEEGAELVAGLAEEVARYQRTRQRRR